MKTAISVPDDIYERASRRARDLGMSRSELFSRAAARYLDELDSESVTRRIDEVIDLLGAPDADGSVTGAVGAGRRLLGELSDEW